jgi:hypothetical protein
VWVKKKNLMLSGQVARPYTPTTGDETIGAMDLVVKVYEQVGYYKSTNADAGAGTKSQILTQKKLLFFPALAGQGFEGLRRYEGR